MVETKFGIILSDCGSEASKILASDLVHVCSDENIKQALKLSVRCLKEKGVSPLSKINAMQFVVIVALSNDHNAYKVARSGVLPIIARLGATNEGRNFRSMFGECVNKSQVVKCASYANSIIDTLSKVEAFDLTLYERLPFGVRYLLSECNKLRLKLLAEGALPLHKGSKAAALNDASDAGQAKEDTETPCLKSYRTRAKEIALEVSRIEDDMEDLGVSGTREEMAERQQGDDAQHSDTRLMELVSKLCHLRGECSNLINEMVDANSCEMHADVSDIIGHIRTLEIQCRNVCVDQDYADTGALNITFSKGDKDDRSCEDDFQTSREIVDEVSYITSLAKDDCMSACSFKSIVTDATAMRKLASQPPVNGDNESEEAPGENYSGGTNLTLSAISQDHESRPAELEHKATAMDWPGSSTGRSTTVASNSEVLASTDATKDDWAAFSDDTVDSSSGINTVQTTDFGSESQEMIELPVHSPTAYQLNEFGDGSMESESPAVRRASSTAANDITDHGTASFESAPSQAGQPSDEDMTDDVVSSARNTLDMVRNVIGDECADESQKQGEGDTSPNTSQSTPKVCLVSETTWDPREHQATNNAGEPDSVNLLDDPHFDHDPLNWVSNIGDVDEEADVDDTTQRESEDSTSSNLSRIRQHIVRGESKIYSDDLIDVSFKHQLSFEGTGSVVECQLTLTNLGTETIEQLQLDFLNFEHFPLHLLLLPMQEDATTILPSGSMEIRFNLYPLGPFIGLPKVTITTTLGSPETARSYTLYLPVPITSFLAAEPFESPSAIEALQKHSKSYFLARNTVPFEEAGELAALGSRLTSFRLDEEPDSVYIMASFYQGLYHDGKNECVSKSKVLIKLEASGKPNAFSMYVYSNSERLGGAVAQLYRYLFHNQGPAYGV
ncbi:uncharacterized protein BcabD6B2_16930 [Babesia caballi]|uniref:Uncharacterized protein n=1 Tax=Babesia caballi TaxID=5871 RepID=A0AAV4LQK3_BABCB|nr:hypothetical protein, conserved [Babesia caballi]